MGGAGVFFMMLNDPIRQTPSLVLPATHTIGEVVAQCRSVALSFVNRGRAFTKSELAGWLSAAYGACAGVDDNPLRRWDPIPLLDEIDARMVSRLLSVSTSEVLEVVGKVANEGGQSFGFAMLTSGLVRQCRDVAGGRGYVPTYEARRLTDMVLALFAADYLTRPSDYELDLSICRHCGVVAVDLDSRTRGHCGRHASTFARRSASGAPGGFPEGA